VAAWGFLAALDEVASAAKVLVCSRLIVTAARMAAWRMWGRRARRREQRQQLVVRAGADERVVHQRNRLDYVGKR
jgi:hypothetical protein